MLERQNKYIKWKLISEDFLLKHRIGPLHNLCYSPSNWGWGWLSFVGFLIKNIWEFKNELDKKEKLTLFFKYNPRIAIIQIKYG